MMVDGLRLEDSASPSRMLRIAYLIDSIEGVTAGTEGQFLTLLYELHRRGIYVRLISLRQQSSLPIVPFPIMTLNLLGLLTPQLVAALDNLRNIVTSERINIVHSVFFDSTVLAALFPRKARIAKVTSRRGFITSERPNRMKLGILRLISSSYDACICNSRALLEFTAEKEGIPRKNLSVIYNGIDVSRFSERRALATSEVTICALANLRPVKNLGFLIDAASVLLRRYPFLRFLLIGDGPERGHLEARIAKHGIGSRVNLVGRSTNPQSVLAEADVGVLTSHSEGFSNALLEYAAAGLPVVAADVGGNREAVDAGVTGYLFTPDDVDEFTRYVATLIEDRELRVRMGTAGRERVERCFGLDRFVRDHINLYERVLGVGC